MTAAKFIGQRMTSDCAVACLAMFLGVDYEQIARHCSGAELCSYGLTNCREEYIARLYQIELEFLAPELIDRARPAVLTVPSLNSPKGGQHAVFWTGERILDPNKGRKGKLTFTNQSAWQGATEGYQRKVGQQ